MATLKRKTSPKKDKIRPLFSSEDYAKMSKEYSDISAQIKVLEDRKKDLSAKIKEGAEQYGVKDDKGSFYLESDDFIMGKVANKTLSIKQDEAVKTLKSMGLGDVVDTVTVETVNEDKLQKAVQDKRISLDEVEKFTDVKVTYSVLVKEKEAMPEVEVSTAKVARKKK